MSAERSGSVFARFPGGVRLVQARARSRSPHGRTVRRTCTAAGRPGDQQCFDAIIFRPLGVTSLPLMPWANRSTYQQSVEIGSHR